MLFPEWVEAQHAKQSAKHKAERAAKRKNPPARFPITDLQAKYLKALSKCGFGVGSPAKRFVRDMQGATELTFLQGLYLAELAHRYRRQLKLTDSEAISVRDKLKSEANAHAQPEQPNGQSL